MIVTIITTCKNSEKTIEDTILSIVNQTYKDIEHIIIDGYSTDNTLSILEKYKDKISCCISENDNNMYEAMNKGLKIAKGELILVLNSDDCLLNNNTIEEVVKLSKTTQSELIGFKIQIVNYDTGENYYKGYDNIDKLWLFKDCVCQQALFYRPKVFNEVGFFDEQYRLVGDYDWLLKAIFKHNVSFTYFDLPIVKFRQQGIFSGNEKIHQIYLKEHKELIKKHFGKTKSKIFNMIFRYFGSLAKVPFIRFILNRFL